MKKIVVDTNIIFSSFLKSGYKFRNIIFSGEFQFYSCNFAIVEIFKYKDKILKYSKLSEDELLEQMHNILKWIYFMSENVISDENFYMAYELCKSIDEKDTPFLALAFELDALLWTSDKKLKKGLNRKGIDLFFEHPRADKKNGGAKNSI